MNRGDAKGLYLHMAAIWPAAANHPASTVSEWVEYLSGLTDIDAQSGVTETRLACDFFPSFAEFNRAVVDGRQQRAILQKEQQPELEPGVADPRTGKRMLAFTRSLLDERREVLTATKLDKAGVRKWRERIASAREVDVVESTYGKNYDLAWAEIRSEYHGTVTT